MSGISISGSIMNREISLEEIQFIANAKNESELNSVWGTIKDWFCWTNKEAAKKALYCSLNEQASAETRLTHFSQLKQLAAPHYQDNLSAAIKEDGQICLSITDTPVNTQVQCGSKEQAQQYMMIWDNTDGLEHLSVLQRMKVLSCLESNGLLDSGSKQTTRLTSITQALTKVIEVRKQLLAENIFLPLSVKRDENSSITISLDGRIHITADMQDFNFQDTSWFNEDRDPAQILENRSPTKAGDVLKEVRAEVIEHNITVHGVNTQNQKRLQIEGLTQQQKLKLIANPSLCQQFVQMNINAFNHPDLGPEGSLLTISLTMMSLSSQKDDSSQNMNAFLITMGKIIKQLNLENIKNIPLKLGL